MVAATHRRSTSEFLHLAVESADSIHECQGGRWVAPQLCQIVIERDANTACDEIVQLVFL